MMASASMEKGPVNMGRSSATAVWRIEGGRKRKRPMSCSWSPSGRMSPSQWTMSTSPGSNFADGSGICARRMDRRCGGKESETFEIESVNMIHGFVRVNVCVRSSTVTDGKC